MARLRQAIEGGGSLEPALEIAQAELQSRSKTTKISIRKNLPRHVPNWPSCCRKLPADWPIRPMPRPITRKMPSG